MKTFDTLYKRTKTGAIQYWKIDVLPMTDGAQIVKEAGQLFTANPTVHREGITKGKNIGKANETRPAQQALFQAESDWKKKKDEGYKSRQDLNIDISGDLMHYSINHVKYKTLTEALNVALPEFNTDASGNVKPMLAKTVDWKKVKYPCIVQPKLDGVRCLMVVGRAGPDLTIKFLSRKGKEYASLAHIAEDVMENAGPEPFILDGEIYSDELTFQQISSAVKKVSEDSLKLKFRAYDVVTEGSQRARWNETVVLVESLNSQHITVVEAIVAHTQDEVKHHHDRWVFEGNEGAMIRLMDGYYGHGQRSSHLLKVKEFDETEFEIVGGKIFKVPITTIPTEVDDREADSFTFTCATSDGKEFDVKPTGSRVQRKSYVLNLTGCICKDITVSHFGYTDDGLPRFPVGKAIRDYE